MQPQRVALLTNFIPPYRLPLYRALAVRFRELRIFISTPMEPNRSWPPEWDGLNVDVQRNLSVRTVWKHPHGFAEPLLIHMPYDTFLRLRKFQPDLVISGEMGFRTIQATLYRLIFRRSRLIIWATLSEYTEQGRGRLRKWLRRILFRFVDAVLVNGESGARYVSRFGVHDSKMFRVPQTTDIAAFASMPLERSSSEERRLLYVGRLIELKGLLPFLSVLRQWAERNPGRSVEFWLAGGGPVGETIQRLQMPRNLSVRLVGDVAYPKLPELYAQAGILVFPTLSDEWGLVVDEAMAAGLPVLGSIYSQAVEELVQEGVNGWSFQPDRAHLVYEALDRAFRTSSEELAGMRATARKTVQGLTPSLVTDRIMRAVGYVTSARDAVASCRAGRETEG